MPEGFLPEKRGNRGTEEDTEAERGHLGKEELGWRPGWGLERLQ